MPRPKKLEWFPLYIHRIKASRRWQQMEDFQRGWYMSLLIESADYAVPGYLPDDPDVLWRLAGAKTKAYFQREGQSVLHCFDGRTEDGKLIYNRALVETLEEQNKKLKRSISLSPAVAVVVDVQKLPAWINQESWDGFWEMRSKHKKKPPDTKRAREGIIGELVALRNEGLDPNALLDQSVTNGWVGIWRPKEGNGNGSSKTQSKNRAAIAGAFRDLAGQADGRNGLQLAESTDLRDDSEDVAEPVGRAGK